MRSRLARGSRAKPWSQPQARIGRRGMVGGYDGRSPSAHDVGAEATTSNPDKGRGAGPSGPWGHSPQADAPILPWAGAVRWRQVARAQGSGLGPEIRPSFRWMGAIDVAEAYDYPEHRHAGYELIAVRRGTYRCRLDGQAVELGEAGLLVVSPGQRHADLLRPPLSYVGLSFAFEGPPLVIPGRCSAAQGDDRVLAILDGLEAEAQRGDRVAARVQDALMQELFWLLVRGLPAASLSPAFVARLDDEGFPARFARACDERLRSRTALADLALKMLDVDPLGLDVMDRKLLEAVIHRFDGGPVGLENLAAAIGEAAETIEDVIEPYLIQQGYLQRTPRGRIATAAAFRHLGLAPPARAADDLFDS